MTKSDSAIILTAWKTVIMKSWHETTSSSKKNENEQCPVLHLQAKHTAKSYPCEKCNFVFATKGKFHIHLSSIQHNISEKQTDSEYEDSDSEEDIVPPPSHFLFLYLSWDKYTSVM